MSEVSATREVEKWGVFELALTHAPSGNPYADVQFGACFAHEHRTVSVAGFYDGGDTFRVRFMPDAVGKWCYETHSSQSELDGTSGTFRCTEPRERNHGPVLVDGRHFVYADGVRYYPFGTTCYAWTHQADDLQERTLSTLRGAAFNKLRMCVFPKDYRYCRNDPARHPFLKKDSGEWDFTRFNPDFFRHLDGRIRHLMALGVEADLIIFHPYDRWGYADMGAEADDRYVRYLTARLAAYRNVWWSMANEYDLVRSKTMADWDRLFRVLQACDPYRRLCSVHNCREFYDHTKPWITHASIQSSDLGHVREWREAYRKPVVVDECRYEGDVEYGWGNITAQELVHRFWLGVLGGGYVGHGETYRHAEDVLWWSKGGVLHGNSPARIAFLRTLVESGPAEGLEPADWRRPVLGAGKGDAYYLFYFGGCQPGECTFEPPSDTRYRADVIDTWEMTISPVEGVFSGRFTLGQPARPYMAVRLQKV